MAGGSYDPHLVDARISINGQQFDDVTVKEVILGESLLTPGLQTAITLQSFVYSESRKYWYEYKNKEVALSIMDRAGDRYMDVLQKIYRIDNRELDVNIGQTETLNLHACDQSLLNDAKSLVSKSWKCARPSEIVDYVLNSCAGAIDPVVDSAGPARDYIAENIHPFQVVQQQCNVALYEDNNPDFLHYMTYENLGTHYFRSLSKLERGSPVITYSSAEGGTGQVADGGKAIAFSFPCDFDLLSDLLNGIDENGMPFNTVSTFNPVNQSASLFGGGSTGGCGIGAGNHKQALSNKGTSQQQNSCDIDVEKYLLLRQARMGLLEKDKITFRITVPWNPDLHVGNIIGFNWQDKYGTPIFGSDAYLAVALKHNIQFGGFATTTLDCIRTNIG